MLNIRNLKIDNASLGTKKLLVDISPAYEYKDNKRTDNVTGYRYTVALPEHGLEKLGVKIEGRQLIDNTSMEMAYFTALQNRWSMLESFNPHIISR